MVKAAGLFQAFTRNMAYGVKALIDQRIEAGESAPADAAAGTRTDARARRPAEAAPPRPRLPRQPPPSRRTHPKQMPEEK